MPSTNITVGSTTRPWLDTSCDAVTEATWLAVEAALSGWRRAKASSAHSSGEPTGSIGSVPAPSARPLSASDRKADTSPAGAGSGAGTAAGSTVSATAGAVLLTVAATAGTAWLEAAGVAAAGTGAGSISGAEVRFPPDTVDADGADATGAGRALRC